jgi:hypothetical protein
VESLSIGLAAAEHVHRRKPMRVRASARIAGFNVADVVLWD